MFIIIHLYYYVIYLKNILFENKLKNIKFIHIV
jgi:hypothetical protein